MSKRFTDTDKWSDPWFRKLPSAYQKLWLLILDKCDNAGFWKVDIDLASFMVNEKLDIENAKKHLVGRIEEIESDKWFIPKFIEFQYGELNPACYPHRPIIKTLEKYKKLGYLLGYFKGINTLQEKEKEKDCINSDLKTVDDLSDFFEVYEMKHGKLHQRQKDGIRLDLMRIPEELRAQAIQQSIKYGQKTIHDPRKFTGEKNGKIIKHDPKHLNPIEPGTGNDDINI